MTIKPSGRLALIVAAGLLVCFAGPVLAASADDSAASPKAESAESAPSKHARHSSRHASPHQKSSTAAKSFDEKPSSKGKAATADASDDRANSGAISPSVADANAQLAASDTASENAKAMAARANTMLQDPPTNVVDAQRGADPEVISADQLNDVDRALQEASPPSQTMASAEAPEAPDARAAPVMASSSSEKSTWDQTSLIGKIFIGFGALLTMASAARMFMT
jgi:hypothetical protein